MYVLYENSGQSKHAGSKARRDIDILLEQYPHQAIWNYSLNNKDDLHDGNRLLYHVIKLLNGIKSYISLTNHMNGGVVFAQYPDYSPRRLSNTVKRFFLKNKMIFLVHDIDGWRSSSKSDEWKRILNHAEALIVHNQKMLERLRMEGVMHPYMVNLELFDYLTDAQISVKSFQKSVVFAGNLGKSQFLQSWMECVRNYDIDLYGVGLKSRSSLPGRVRYHGGYAPEVLPCAIDGGFGLVWDGGSIDTCSGVMGGYMRWNNPHKLSLYIATGIPVIVWKESAVADLVAKYDIGYCISSLDEINHIMDRIDDQRYAELQDHLRPIQKKVLHGEFFKAAMNQVIQQIGI